MWEFCWEAGYRLASREKLGAAGPGGGVGGCRCHLDAHDATAFVFVWTSAPFVCVRSMSVPLVVADICSERVVLRVRLFSA